MREAWAVLLGLVLEQRSQTAAAHARGVREVVGSLAGLDQLLGIALGETAALPQRFDDERGLDDHHGLGLGAVPDIMDPEASRELDDRQYQSGDQHDAEGCGGVGAGPDDSVQGHSKGKNGFPG